MTQSPAGWHPDQQDPAAERYWDGAQWTEQRRPKAPQPPSPTMTQATIQFAPVTTPPPSVVKASNPWYRKTWALVLLAFIIGIGIGGASAGGGTPNPKTSSAYRSLDAKLTSAGAARDKAKADLVSLAGNVPAREAAVTKAEGDIAKREAADDATAKSLLKREKVVGIVEREVARNTVSGDGIYKVGSDIKAGTYKTKGRVGCYYAILNSTDTSNISDNDNLDGPGFLTVHPGQYLQLQNCGDWVLQR